VAASGGVVSHGGHQNIEATTSPGSTMKSVAKM
jgi:hypothetical protein